MSTERRPETSANGQLGVRVAAEASFAPRLPLPHPTRDVFDRELAEVKENVLRMGSYVESAVGAALDALTSHDSEAALEVITGDVVLNEMQRKVSSMITATIATQQPVARDLRFLLALDHVSYELERMGDHAASVAKQVRRLSSAPVTERYDDLKAMGDLCGVLVHGTLRALVDIDVARARAVAATDDEVDHLYHRTFDSLLEMMAADPANVPRGTQMIFIAYYLERIGDRATNIAEDVVFLATGEIEDLNP